MGKTNRKQSNQTMKTPQESTKTPKKRNLKGRKKTMYEALVSSLGNITTAAKKAEIDRTTHYLWIRKDANYKRWCEELPEEKLDFYEGALNKLAQAGNVTAIIFALKTLGKSRGYIERQEIVHDGRIDSSITYNDLVEAMNNEP